MDANRFDDLLRTLTASSSRRGIARALGSFALAGPLGALLGRGDSGAKKKHKNKGRRNKNTKRKCLVGQHRCRDRRCHGCCSNADCGGNECEQSVCRDCPRNQRLCRGGCIPESSCCTDDECDGDQTCVAGVCGCRANERLCDGACIPVEYCCTSDDCDGAPCEDGQCQCGANQRDCHGRCIPDDACCTSTDCDPCETCQNDRCVSFCPAGQTCQNGQCGCASGQRLCQGECIPETSCCRSSDCSACERCENEVCVDTCPAGLTCQGGVCACPSGEKPCGDTCIPSDACCPACTGELICDAGTCVCPGGTFPCGDTCVTGDECCVDADCGGDQTCIDGVCVSCPSGFIACGEQCCDAIANQVCAVSQTDAACQGGGCPPTDFCSDPITYVCEADGCACVTSINAASACTNFAAAECIECENDASCVTALGQPAVCIAKGQFCVETCPEIVTGFCVPIGCPSSPLSAGRQGRGRGGRRLKFRK